MKEIIVPKDIDAEKALEYDSATDEQVVSWKLSEEEFLEMWETGAFRMINEMCGTIIDEYENDSISGISNLERSLGAISGLPENVLIGKLKLLIQSAIKFNTSIHFYF